MRRQQIFNWLALLLFPCCSSSFVIYPSRTVPSAKTTFSVSTHGNNQILLFLSSDLNEEDKSVTDSNAPKKSRKKQRRRVRRKDTPKVEPPSPESSSSSGSEDEEAATMSAESEPVAPEPPAPILQPREDSPVELKVQDVRELVGTRPSTVSTNTQSPVEATTTASDSSEPATVASSSASTSASSTSTSSNALDDSLQMLLADARRMQEEEKENASSDDSSEGVDMENMKSTVRDVLSTVVTADFFLVCGFLLWFLVGIFASSVLNDDTIQIAFNSNFQAFVQPALGVLMIGALAGQFLKDEEEEEFMN